MNKIKVAVCDDIQSICVYFKTELTKDDEIEFAGMAHNVKDCCALVKSTAPDILLLDIQMETSDAGIRAIPQVLEQSPGTKIIMLTIHNEDEFLFRSFVSGASDYLIKTASTDEILGNIKSVYYNTYTLRPDIAQKILYQCQNMHKQQQSMLFALNLVSKLSTSEFEILKDLYSGLTYKEVAKKRFVEEITVRVQITSILKKLGFKRMKMLLEFLNSTNVFDFINN